MGGLDSLFSPLSKFFYWILEFIHGWGVSWSWSIVILTIFVRIVLIPLTWRQIKSMRAMQALAPQIKVLQEKYKDNKQLLNQKTMEFYQENKVSPFGSCLPADPPAAGLPRPVLHAPQPGPTGRLVRLPEPHRGLALDGGYHQVRHHLDVPLHWEPVCGFLADRQKRRRSAEDNRLYDAHNGGYLHVYR